MELTPEQNAFLDVLINDLERRIEELEKQYKDAEYALISVAGQVAESKVWLEELKKRRNIIDVSKYMQPSE